MKKYEWENEENKDDESNNEIKRKERTSAIFFQCSLLIHHLFSPSTTLTHVSVTPCVCVCVCPNVPFHSPPPESISKLHTVNYLSMKGQKISQTVSLVISLSLTHTILIWILFPSLTIQYLHSVWIIWEPNKSTLIWVKSQMMWLSEKNWISRHSLPQSSAQERDPAGMRNTSYHCSALCQNFR